DVIITLVPIEYVRVSGVKITNNFLEALEFLPGSAIRGAVAKSFSSVRGGWKDIAVREAFLHNPVIFSNFYPNATAQPYLPKPVPLSARTCKAFPGFQCQAATAKERASHGTKDILIAATVVKLLREQGIPALFEDACEYMEDGKRCNSALKQLEGFYLYPYRDGEASKKVSRRTTTKTAINRSRFTSSDGQLYSYEVLNPRLECFEEITQPEKRRLRFIGLVRNLSNELKEYLAEKKPLLIGGAKGRGFGKMKIKNLTDIKDESHNDLKQRFDKFTSLVQELLRATGHPKANRLFFSLTLNSDLLLPPGSKMDYLKGEVERILKLPERGLELEKAFVRIDYRSGFNEALGIQKDLLPVLIRGSSFVFSCNPDDNIKESIINSLFSLLRNGLGWRREEGFGQISFCDPFHIERIKQN
ncbi:MAG: hypothetical protein QXH91_01155, partial [Candidatus Bathyarchaeia archaeon]